MNTYLIAGVVALAKFGYDVWKKKAGKSKFFVLYCSLFFLSLGNSQIAAGLSVLGNLSLILSVFLLSGILSWVVYGITEDYVLTKGKKFHSKLDTVHPFIYAVISSALSTIVFNSMAKAHESFPEASESLYDFVILLHHPLFRDRVCIVLLVSAIIGLSAGFYKKTRNKKGDT